MKLGMVLVLALCLVPAGVSVADEPTYAPAPAPDTTPPQTTIERSVLRIATRSATFWFSASEAAQGFQCQLDRGEFKPCGSPRTYKHLKTGKHAFRVTAVDVAGTVDGSPAVVHFRVPRPYRGRR